MIWIVFSIGILLAVIGATSSTALVSMSRLELVYDNAVTSLVIGSPRPGEAVGRAVQALGVAPLGSKLYINGKPTRLDEKGRFAERVAGAPTLVFRLVDRSGRESYWIRRLRTGS